jgi:hypothetical protein
MFGKLLTKIKQLARERGFHGDPNRFDDPVALQTEWGPAKGGGTNFRTHRLVSTGPERMEFRASLGAKLFYGVFLLVGLGVIAGVASAAIAKGVAGFRKQETIGILFGLVFATVGGLLWYFGTAPIVFDRRKGRFWKGRKSPDEVFGKSSLKYFATFEEIHALQLVSEYCSGNKHSYYSYELNLVLADGRRINVIDHGRIQEDARQLAEFLDKPLWDAI